MEKSKKKVKSGVGIYTVVIRCDVMVEISNY